MPQQGLFQRAASNVWTPGEPSNGHSAPNWAPVLTGEPPSVSAIARKDDTDLRVSDEEPDSVSVPTIFGRAKRHDPNLRTLAVHA